MIAEVLYTTKQVGPGSVAGWVSEFGQVKYSQMQKLRQSLPDADFRLDPQGLKIVVNVEESSMGKSANRATGVATAIYYSLGIKPGFCPVSYNSQILGVTDAG